MLPIYRKLSSLLTFCSTQPASSSDMVIRRRSNCSDFHTFSGCLCLQNVFRYLHPSQCLQRHFLKAAIHALVKKLCQGMLPCYHFQKQIWATQQLHLRNMCKILQKCHQSDILAQSLLRQFWCYSSVSLLVFGSSLNVLICHTLKIKSESLSGQSQSVYTAHKILVILTEKHKRVMYGIFYCLQVVLVFLLVVVGGDQVHAERFFLTSSGYFLYTRTWFLHCLHFKTKLHAINCK